MEEDWICDIIENTYRNYRERKIILWGKCGASDKVQRALKQVYQITIEGYIDNSQSKVNDSVFYVPDFLATASKEEYYIVVPLAFSSEVVEMLWQSGFEKDRDYYYFSECILEQRKDYYEDTHGNKIIGETGRMQVIFFGFHSTVIIGKKAEFAKAGKIYIYSNARLEIGENTKLAFLSNVSIGKDAKVSIGWDCNLINIKFMYVRSHAELEIGEKTTAWYGLCIYLFEWSKVTLGKDCMLSHDIKIYSNDGHSIFDRLTGKNINSTEEICKKRNIFIGSHVWIGMGATILYGSKIGNGSIVGAESLVKGNVPENCIVCGNPARVIRRNIAWSRENCAEDFLI